MSGKKRNQDVFQAMGKDLMWMQLQEGLFLKQTKEKEKNIWELA